MGDELDPYRVLGIPVGADDTAIRRRYRELVRKHHPDVSSDSQKAHQRFVRIQEAYRMLMDPEQRARWERQAGVGAVDEAEIRVGSAGTRFEQLLSEGRRLLRHRRVREARDVVAAAIELNPFDAAAYRLLGDIYAAGGNMQMALELYREAKFLEGEKPPHEERRAAPPERAAPEPEPARPTTRVTVLVVGLGGACVCLGAMAAIGFTGNHSAFVALGAVAAFLVGSAGVVSGAVEPVDELLGLAEVREPGRGAAPGALYLIIISVISPYLGILYYGIVSVVTESWSRGILKIYASAFVLALAAWLAASGEGGVAFALVAPSLAFLGMLAGWVAGSFAAPGEWWRR
jgi:tetratricopeptide (TPR) repeat protein